MNPTYHSLRVFRKKSCLTQEDIATLLGTKDISQICRLENSHTNPQIELCLLYHLLFNKPAQDFFPEQIIIIRKRLLIRIPNIIDELKCLKSSPLVEKKISFLSEVLINLSQST